MNRKTVMAISLGILAAAVICIGIGIVFYCLKQSAIYFLIGLFMICLGSIMAIVPLILLIIMLITFMVANRKNK